MLREWEAKPLNLTNGSTRMGSDLQNVPEICVFLYPTPLRFAAKWGWSRHFRVRRRRIRCGSNLKKKKKNCSRSGFLLLILILFLLLDGVSFTGRCKFLVLNFYVLWLDCSIVCLVAWKVLWIAGENLLDVFGKIYQYLFNLFFLKKKYISFLDLF